MNTNLVIRGGYRKYDEVTFLKGFSIFSIIIMHLMQGFYDVPPLVNKAVSLGGTGVHIFFFCSGFGLFLSYLNKKQRCFEFFRIRFLRVYIPYIIVVVICFFLPFIIVGENRIVAILSHIFLFKMFVPEFEASFGGQMWFISTIFQFYFVFLPLCMLKERVGRRMCFLLCFGASVIWWIITAISGANNIRVIGSFFIQYLWEFSLGMVVAEILYEEKDIEIKNKVLVIIFILGLGLEGILAYSSSTLKVFNDIPALLGFGSLGLLLYQVKILIKPFSFLGNISYEIFLIHMAVYYGIFSLVTPHGMVRGIFIGVCGIAFTIALSYLFHTIIVGNWSEIYKTHSFFKKSGS